MSDRQSIHIDEATPEQLREFAATVLGIQVHANKKPENVRADIRAAWQSDQITVASAPEALQKRAEPQAPTAAAEQQADVPYAKRKIRIRIPEDDKPGGSEPVPVGVNGSLMLIPRNKDCEIPLPYYEALMHATERHYLVDENEQITGHSDRPRFPVQALGEVA